MHITLKHLPSPLKGEGVLTSPCEPPCGGGYRWGKDASLLIPALASIEGDGLYRSLAPAGWAWLSLFPQREDPEDPALWHNRRSP
jgi:hypothetical protein